MKYNAYYIDIAIELLLRGMLRLKRLLSWPDIVSKTHFKVDCRMDWPATARNQLICCLYFGSKLANIY